MHCFDLVFLDCYVLLKNLKALNKNVHICSFTFYVSLDIIVLRHIKNCIIKVNDCSDIFKFMHRFSAFIIFIIVYTNRKLGKNFNRSPRMTIGSFAFGVIIWLTINLSFPVENRVPGILLLHRWPVCRSLVSSFLCLNVMKIPWAVEGEILGNFWTPFSIDDLAWHNVK